MYNLYKSLSTSLQDRNCRCLYMKTFFNNLHKKYPFLDSVISLIFGAVIGYLFQNVIDVWKQSGTVKEKVISFILFAVSILIASVYYKFFYSKDKKTTELEKEREKSKIQWIKNEREMITSLYKQGAKAMEKEDLSIIEKAEIVKHISSVTNDNKREI